MSEFGSNAELRSFNSEGIDGGAVLETVFFENLELMVEPAADQIYAEFIPANNDTWLSENPTDLKIFFNENPDNLLLSARRFFAEPAIQAPDEILVLGSNCYWLIEISPHDAVFDFDVNITYDQIPGINEAASLASFAK